MPADLNEGYERILAKCMSAPIKRYMQRALVWLCFAARPLRLVELSEAIVVEDEDVDLDEENRLRNPEQLLSWGQGLFDFDRETTRITLGHSSVKSFLTTPEWIRSSCAAAFEIKEFDAHNMIMRTCLTYLKFRKFAVGCEESPDYLSYLAIEYPLLTYATLKWPLHVRAIEKADWDDIVSFFSTKALPRGGNYGFWIRYISGLAHEGTITKSSPLYYAASFGFSTLVSAFVKFQRPLNLEQGGGRVGSTALQVACFRKQRECARLLVMAGANPFSPDGSGLEGGFSSLFWAELNGWDDIVQLMLHYGAAHGFKPNNEPHTQNATRRARLVQYKDWEYSGKHEQAVERLHWVNYRFSHLHETRVREYLSSLFPNMDFEISSPGFHLRASMRCRVPRPLTEVSKFSASLRLCLCSMLTSTQKERAEIGVLTML